MVPIEIVVIAGGSGTRFWPLSRRRRPKQLLSLGGDQTLLQRTFERVTSLAGIERWWMVVGESHSEACADSMIGIQKKRVLVEPCGRNTAPAIGLAAAHLDKASPDSIMVVLPADHHVGEAERFCDGLIRAREALLAQEQLAAGAATKDGLTPGSRDYQARVRVSESIVCLGIKPTHPETGYGYIERGAALSGQGGAFKVARFCEKPDIVRAREFLQTGRFFWNAGIFVMRPRTLLQALKWQLPAVHTDLMEIAEHIGSPDYERVKAEVFPRISPISIDYGVMEGFSRSLVVEVDCGWSDVGSFGALDAVIEPDARGNVVLGPVVSLDTERCTVVAAEDGGSDGEHVVATLGLRDVVVVHTEDATMVMDSRRCQDVAALRAEIERRGWRDKT